MFSKWGLITFIFSMNLFAADTNCVSCGNKTVAGLPNLKGLNQIEKVVAKTNESPVIPLGKFYDYCANFESASNFRTVEPVIDKIVRDGYSAEDTLARNDCLPNELQGDNDTVPLVQLIAEDISGRFNFPKDIYEYFERKNKVDSWVRIINVKNSQGMTLLDYLKFVWELSRNWGPQATQHFKDVFKYICDRSGQMSYYKNTDCKKGL